MPRRAKQNMRTARTARTAPGPRHDRNQDPDSTADANDTKRTCMDRNQDPGTKRTCMDRDQDPGAGADSGSDEDEDTHANDRKRTCTDPDQDPDASHDSGEDSDADAGNDSDQDTDATLPTTPTPPAAGKPLFCCQICGIFMGPHNPRQLCAKYFCCNEP